MASIENATVEQLEHALKVRTAQERKEELEGTGLQDFKNAVASATDIEEVYRLVSNFKWKVEQFRRVLIPASGKRGRKAKSS